MKRLQALILAAVMTFGPFCLPVTALAEDGAAPQSAAPAAQTPETAADHLLIDQVYADGSKTDTPIAASFVELYNPTAEDASLDEYTLVLDGTEVTFPDQTVVKAGGYYLLAAREDPSEQDYLTLYLPEPDQLFDKPLENKEFEVSLLHNGSEVDAVSGSDYDMSKQKTLRRADHGDFETVKWEKATVAVDAAYAAAYAPYNAAGEQGTVYTGDVQMLYTNDVHNAYLRTDDRLGYAAVAGRRDLLQAQGYAVTVLDGGDAIQGEAIGALTTGEALVQMMNAVGYDYAVPGNHEFDFGMDRFLALADEAQYEYLSCNFVDLRTGKTVFRPYEIADFNGLKVAFVGITTPETFTKSTPSYFQDAEGNYIYGFCEGNDGRDLYDAVQNAVDAARAEGAQAVIAVGHLGTDTASAPWTSREVIANTTGLTAFLDGHSHSTIAGETVTDKAGSAVLLCSTGTKLASVAQLTLHTDASAETRLLDGTTLTAARDNADVAALAAEKEAEFNDLLSRKVATSSVTLTVSDPVTGGRLVRSQETNLGDLCADAYRAELGADIAFVNGGGIRADIAAGDVTYGDIIAVHPFGNMACVVEATGQQILDALEMSSRAVDASGAELGGFLQVSGLSYEIDTTIPSTVRVDEKGMFVGVEGARRVRNVRLSDGTPLDPQATYTLASHNYMLKSGGDGLNMFMQDTVLKDEVMVDNEVLINYIVNTLGGTVGEAYANPYGDGRIKVILEEQQPADGQDGYQVLLQGDPNGENGGRITVTLPATSGENGWVVEDGVTYWYENGVKQGTEGRGKEIYDPASDGWYWLDAIQGGAKAVSKDVYQESSGGKWVRYDADGKMVKGWDQTGAGTYYFDPITGAMAKGRVTIDGKAYTFDRITGVMA